MLTASRKAVSFLSVAPQDKVIVEDITNSYLFEIFKRHEGMGDPEKKVCNEEVEHQEASGDMGYRLLPGEWNHLRDRGQSPDQWGEGGNCPSTLLSSCLRHCVIKDKLIGENKFINIYASCIHGRYLGKLNKTAQATILNTIFS